MFSSISGTDIWYLYVFASTLCVGYYLLNPEEKKHSSFWSQAYGISIPGFLAGLFIVIKPGMEKILLGDPAFSILSTGIIVAIVFSFISKVVDGKHLKNSSQYFDGAMNEPKEVCQVDAKQVITYPRITIHTGKWSSKKNEIIFDSSDFSVINKTLRTFENYQPSFIPKHHFFLNKKQFLVKNVRVDFMSIFDNYSYNTLGYAHTPVYKGDDIPYNIQMIIEVEEVIDSKTIQGKSI